MRVVVTGTSGLLGSDIERALQEEHEVIGLAGRKDLDVTEPADTLKVISAAKPDVIVHVAGWKELDDCELDPRKAFLINSFGTQNVVHAAQQTGSKIVYISTDCVFDGTKGAPYSEYDQTNPINAYGKSKLAAEKVIRAQTPRYFIVRVPLLFGIHGYRTSSPIHNTIDKAKAGQELVATNDQTCNPTYTFHVGKAIELMIGTEHYGTYHVTNKGEGSRFEALKAYVEELGLKDAKLRAAASDSLGRPAPRPRYTAFWCDAFEKTFGWELPHWREALKECIAELKAGA